MGTENSSSPPGVQWEQTDCPLCGSPRQRCILRGTDLIHQLPGEFQLARCGDCRHVFVDSAGTGPADGRLAALLPELAAMKRGPRSLQTLLVLPANVQREDLLGAIARFAPAAPVAAALTKIDECSRFGGALSALIGTRTPLAWLADGQAVPRDLHRVDREDGGVLPCLERVSEPLARKLPRLLDRTDLFLEAVLVLAIEVVTAS